MTSEDSQELLLLISSMQKRHERIYSLCIRSDAFSELMESAVSCVASHRHRLWVLHTSQLRVFPAQIKHAAAPAKQRQLHTRGEKTSGPHLFKTHTSLASGSNFRANSLF